MIYILKQSGIYYLDHMSRGATVYVPSDDLELSLIIAETRTRERLRLPPKHMIEKLKNLLETDEDPKWYVAYNDDVRPSRPRMPKHFS